MFSMNYGGQEALRAGHLNGNVLWKTTAINLFENNAPPCKKKEKRKK